MDHRTLRRSGIIAASLWAAITLAGCAAEEAAEPAVTPQEPTTELTIEVTDGQSTTWTLTCDPAGGDHPEAEAACAALAKNGEQALTPTPADSMCTQIFGGEQTAVITGTWQGKGVNADFSRKNGCEISRWEALTPLLPNPA